MPMTLPNAWNQNGSLSRERSADAAVVAHDVLRNRRPQRRHPRGEPSRHAATVQRKIGDAGAFHTTYYCAHAEPRDSSDARPLCMFLCSGPGWRARGAAGARAAVRSEAVFHRTAIAPDRSEIAFASGGDLWTAPLAGGDARLLVSHAANESQPLFSPDGKTRRVRLRPHRRRRHLPAHVRDRRPAAADVRRRQRAPRRLVARRTVDLLLLELARDRRLTTSIGSARRRHADAGDRRSFYERVRRGAVA